MNSAPAVEWLSSRFNLDLSIVNRLGGHTHPRTHRGPERFPGMTITYALMEKLEEIAKQDSYNARIQTKAHVNKLISDSTGAVVGVEYLDKNTNQTVREHGVVVLATGGFGADFTETGLLKQLRPDLMDFPTTNGDHCTGDGIKMAQAIGAATVDLKQVQVHPTGLVHPDEPNAKVKFLAAEALRGCGGLLLDKNGNRFCDDLGTRDYVSGRMMQHNSGPYRLVLNSKASKQIEWHCKHYVGRGLMKRFDSGTALAKEMKIPISNLDKTFRAYNDAAEAKKNDKDLDPWKKRFFPAAPWKTDDQFYVAWVCPVVHYCMGGIKITPEAEVATDAKVIPGLFAAGEVTGGVHGNNRLGGSSLQDCVVYGRVAGASAARYLTAHALKAIADPASRLNRLGGQFAPGSATIKIDVANQRLKIKFGDAQHLSCSDKTPASSRAPARAPAPATGPAPAAASPAPAVPAAAAASGKKVFTLADVASHNKESDCWVVVNGQVLDVTTFMKEHPGGKQAILLFAGKDASAEFNMLHKKDVVEKYAPKAVLGDLDAKEWAAIEAKMKEH